MVMCTFNYDPSAGFESEDAVDGGDETGLDVDTSCDV